MRRGHQNLINRIIKLSCLVPLLVVNLPVQNSAVDLAAYPWFYLRKGIPPGPAESLVEIIAVGDVMPGRGLAGTRGIFDHVSSELERADLVIGNLEGTIAEVPLTDTKLSLVLPIGTQYLLADAGFDLLSLANNHSKDAGLDNYEKTARSLLSAGIQPLEIAQPFVREIKGLRIAFLAWNEIPPVSHARLFSVIEAVRPGVDIIIVQVHWGQEYQRHPNWSQRKLAAGLLEAGVDIILGSHPHVVQDLLIERSGSIQDRSHLVAYSLGNFVFDQGWEDTRQGLGLRLLLDHNGLRAAQALPVWSTLRPRWMAAVDAADLLERVLPIERAGFLCTLDSCHPVQVPQEDLEGHFWSGLIDLTGNGRTEIIRRQVQSIVIYQDGQAVWHSPPEWRVLDLALGDPNDDGRNEILLAIEKTDLSGNSTYHPFIIGYRGGIYRLLWGGSAVSDPLLEVEVGDLDGDGRDELSAIEASDDGIARHVTVWRWHGWGFSLVWRSPAGNYHELMILPAEETQPSRLSVADG